MEKADILLVEHSEPEVQEVSGDMILKNVIQALKEVEKESK